MFDNSGKFIYYLEQVSGLKIIYDIQADQIIN